MRHGSWDAKSQLAVLGDATPCKIFFLPSAGFLLKGRLFIFQVLILKQAL